MSRTPARTAATLVPASLAAALLGAVLLVAPAHAVTETDTTTDTTTVTWGVRPADAPQHDPGRPNFAYVATPGETVEDGLVVSNHGAAETTLRVYVADAFTTSRGVLDLLRPDEESTGVGAWATVATPEITIPAGESVVVPFTLAVPVDAEPGDHAGGVVTSLASTQADGVSVDRRLGARIHLRVDGPVTPGVALEDTRVAHRGVLNPVGAGSAVVDVDVVNTGNVRVGGEATVTVAGPFGWGERVERVDVPELLPGERTTVAVTVGDVLPLLRLGATVRLAPQVATDGSALEAVTATAATAAVPWSLLVLILLAVAAVVAARWRARRRAAATERLVAEAVAAARAEADPVAVP
ncbi:WxL protein peptidoglycan domain-containing protein [Cellulomonas sp. S1-8]|uniref:WxL protein peptidoglycan domain-containing protein n=1 Tax=Cellulomonas sp. S1-8 TaxID=2904790 RepID=UPI0022435CC2|nr:DUF916 domain-containing protein [Cellulomonas sp. S1-8]UZN04340.1 DUF916 domain-containing protein [Cellulomonas sp. S1-8]